MLKLTSVSELESRVGNVIGVGDWVEITQERINTFADATGDHQWIHVDVDRAALGPFGTTVAHGYLTLSMLPWLAGQVVEIAVGSARINYGLNKVRFPAPVRVGSRIRASVEVRDVVATPAGHQVTLLYVIEIAGQDRPACVAEAVTLLVR